MAMLAWAMTLASPYATHALTVLVWIDFQMLKHQDLTYHLYLWATMGHQMWMLC